MSDKFDLKIGIEEEKNLKIRLGISMTLLSKQIVLKKEKI